MNIDQLLDDLLAGYRMGIADAEFLLKAKGPEVWKIACAADELRRRKIGDVVTYVRNQNIHVTNICKNLCGFCAFGVSKGHDHAYEKGPDYIREMTRLALVRDVTEICFLSGVHPDYSLERYEEILRCVHEIAPDMDIHTASPDEVSFMAKKGGIQTKEVLERLRDAGLGTLQGTAAEILVDDVRRIICPAKISTRTWINIIREAHELGLKSTSTIMYGTIESELNRAEHLSILRDIQDDTSGFTELVPLPWVQHNTYLYRSGRALYGPTGREDILLLAVSRLFLDNFDHIQVPWGKVGLKMTAAGLMSGGDDMGGTMFVDSVSTEAGASEAGFFNPDCMRQIVDDIGRTLRQRTTDYRLIE